MGLWVMGREKMGRGEIEGELGGGNGVGEER